MLVRFFARWMEVAKEVRAWARALVQWGCRRLVDVNMWRITRGVRGRSASVCGWVRMWCPRRLALLTRVVQSETSPRSQSVFRWVGRGDLFGAVRLAMVLRRSVV